MKETLNKIKPLFGKGGKLETDKEGWELVIAILMLIVVNVGMFFLMTS